MTFFAATLGANFWKIMLIQLAYFQAYFTDPPRTFSQCVVLLVENAKTTVIVHDICVGLPARRLCLHT